MKVPSDLISCDSTRSYALPAHGGEIVNVEVSVFFSFMDDMEVTF